MTTSIVPAARRQRYCRFAMTAESAKLTPMLRHYLEVKSEHPDALLLYRMGDFYELFFDDAKEAAPILDVQLTARQKGTPSEAPMCGVPHHAVESYIARLVEAGRRVAVCDQMEDPATAKGMVRREVTRVVTPGTLVEIEQLDADRHNYLACLIWEGGGGAGAFLDLSTGRLRVHRWTDADDADEDLQLLEPREVLAEVSTLPEDLHQALDGATAIRLTDLETALPGATEVTARAASEALKRQFGVATLRGFGLKQNEPAVRAAAAALRYAATTQGADPQHVRVLEVDDGRASVVDSTTLRNLEVLRNLRDGGRDSSVVAVLDRTRSAAGGRKLADWLREPLVEVGAIRDRHDAVADLLDDPSRRTEIRERLASVGDLRRLASRAVLGRMAPREADAVRTSLQQVPVLQGLCKQLSARALNRIASVDALTDLVDDLERTLSDEPAGQLNQGGVIAPGVDTDLDRARSLAGSGKEHLMELQARERDETGIGNLKVRYNKVFGYYLEVTHAHQDKVPEHYRRKQTLVNAERYITDELKQLEESILGAEQQQLALEAQLFSELVERIGARSGDLAVLADALSDLDVLASFAEVAGARGYVRPTMTEPGEAIRIDGGRHPVVEAVSDDPFVANDTRLGDDDPRMVILTGPNMGGKSTYLRQVGLISILAQAGSFVPATKARLAVVDRIFSRVGASDDLARGESTFMVEMIETSRILHQATGNSLVILDEVGRGTATFDGLSLAWSIVEFLHGVEGLKAIFATHYHELTDLARDLPAATNNTMAVKEWEDKVVFLRRVIAGSADKSYGLHVAELAGIPAEVVERAGEILADLERAQVSGQGQPRASTDSPSPPDSRQPDQLSLFTPPEEIVADILRSVDTEALTPLAALNLLETLKDRLG